MPAGFRMQKIGSLYCLPDFGIEAWEAFEGFRM